MVSLPELGSFSNADWKALERFSPISSHYSSILKRPPKTLGERLRHRRHEEWLKCAFANFFQNLHPKEICHYWSHQADLLLREAWTELQMDKTGVHLFALGKLGSQELNMSSDIDIMFVRNDSSGDKREGQLVKEFIQTIHEPTDRGFVFRVDTDLRPGGKSSPLISDVDSFVNFYGYLGEGWNRISLIRLRSLAGPGKIADQIMKFRSSYSFPRRMDYLIIESMRNLLEKIHRSSDDKLNIKLAPGGIRDLELFIQAKQVIYGGRLPGLKVADFSEALTRLLENKVLAQNEFDFIYQFYWQLRHVENSIHLSEDRHTYNVDKLAFDKFNFTFSFTEFQELMARSSRLVSTFFAKDDEYQDKVENILASKELSEGAKQAVEAISQSVPLPSNRSVYINRNRRQLISKFYDYAVSVGIDSDLALETFHDFLKSARSDSSIYYILNNNSAICEQLAWLFSFSPLVGRILSARPELLDSFALGSVEISTENKDLETLLEDLQDYKLLNHLVATSYFIKSKDVLPFIKSLSNSADMIAKALLEFLGKSFDISKLDILCLGKWGGCELGIHSDLDFVFVVDAAPQTHHFQVVKRFTNLVSSPSRGGKLFNIDLRLKPNEQAGPLIVDKAALNEFITIKSEAWQKQAYLKSRYLQKGGGVYSSISQAISLTQEDFAKLADIRSRLLKKHPDNTVDLKYGFGGLVHSEFIIQQSLLQSWPWSVGASLAEHFAEIKRHFTFNEKIWTNYLQLRTIEQFFSICTDLSTARIVQNHPALPRLQKALRIEALFDHLQSMVDCQKTLLDELESQWT